MHCLCRAAKEELGERMEEEKQVARETASIAVRKATSLESVLTTRRPWGKAVLPEVRRINRSTSRRAT